MIDEDRWLVEYQLNVELWKHDDAMRQARNATFMSIQSALLVATGLVFTATDLLWVQGVAAIVSAVLGYLICSVWQSAQARHSAYARFHDRKLRSLEVMLPVTTFTEMKDGVNRGNPVTLAPGGISYTRQADAGASSKEAEKRLPGLIGSLWLVVGVVGVALNAFAVYDRAPGEPLYERPVQELYAPSQLAVGVPPFVSER